MSRFTLFLVKQCMYRTTSMKIRSYTSTDIIPKVSVHKKLDGDINFMEVLPTWTQDKEQELRSQVLKHMRIIPEFVTEAEEASLLAEVEPQLKRMRYEFDHWDNAIEGYRETERSTWNSQNNDVLKRIRSVFSPGTQLLPYAHILDLSSAGYIRPHVDAIRFCGDMIAGLCLMSSAVMRLVHEKNSQLTVDALLQRRCLYIMSGVARYQFTHAVLGGDDSVWKGEKLPRKRRVAIICRERPKPEDTA